MIGVKKMLVLAVAVAVCSGGAVLGTAVPRETDATQAVSPGLYRGPDTNEDPATNIGVPIGEGNPGGMPEVSGANPLSPGGTPVVVGKIPGANGLSDRFSDWGEDGNGNGLYDYLVVEASYTLPGPAIYERQGRPGDAGRIPLPARHRRRRRRHVRRPRGPRRRPRRDARPRHGHAHLGGVADGSLPGAG